MSKLSENLKAFTTGIRVAPQQKLKSVSFKTSAYEQPPYLIGYRLECNIGSQFFVNENDTQALTWAIAKSKRAILEEIFGEFHQDLYNLDVALYNQDYQKAKTLLDDVMKNMFDY